MSNVAVTAAKDTPQHTPPQRKRYNPVLFSRRETQTIPKLLKDAEDATDSNSAGAHLIHNVHAASAAAASNKRVGDGGRGHDDDGFDDDDDDDDGRRRSRQGCWARCCFACCGRAREEAGDFYTVASDYDGKPASRSLRQAGASPSARELRHLPPLPPHMRGKKTLVLDLDETLVHSSFKEVPGYDIRLEVEIQREIVSVYVMVRAGVQELFRRLAPHYELVVYTASLAKYANPLLDILDTNRCISARLFREHCAFSSGSYVKDLAALGRRLNDTLIVDNSPTSYMFHPRHGIPCTNFIDNKADRELFDIIEFCERIHAAPDVVPECLKYKRMWRRKYNRGRPHGF